jgi:hypothetical protein
VWCARSFGSSEAAVDAVVAASEEDDAGELMLEGKVVDDEAIKL